MSDFICAKCGAPNGDGFNPDYYTPTGDYSDPVADAAPDLLEELTSLVAKIEAAGWHKSETESARNALRKAGQTAPDSAPAPWNLNNPKQSAPTYYPCRG